MRTASLMVLGCTIGLGPFLPASACAEEVPVKYRATIAKGLDWLSHNQHHDGHWTKNGSKKVGTDGLIENSDILISLTSLSGIAMLMEGSTIREGKYRDNIRHAVDWLMSQSRPNGLIETRNEGSGYIYGHGYAMLFLSSVVGEEENTERRQKLVDILDRAAGYSRGAQSKCGGWGYVSAKDGQDWDEGSVTVTQLQALRAARNAGIVVPAAVIQDAMHYLHEATNDYHGGVVYSHANLSRGFKPEGRPVITAAAIVCGFSMGDYGSSYIKNWFKFCRAHLPDSYILDRRIGHDEYTYYYYAQAIYMLGEDGWAKLFPGDKNPLTWNAFRAASFDGLARSQLADGYWEGGETGRVFATALHLCILQLDKAVLPIYQR